MIEVDRRKAEKKVEDRVKEEKRREEQVRESQKKEDAGARKGRKAAKRCVFPMIDLWLRMV